MNVKNEKLPERKTIRLKDYDYSSSGAYFITICAFEKRNYFWHESNRNVSIEPDYYLQEPIVCPPLGANIDCFQPKEIELSRYGKIVVEAIKRITVVYPAISIDCYVIMPNHVHIMLFIGQSGSGRPMVAPTISRVINQMKGYASKCAGTTIWQKSFHDHVIRNREDYDEHVRYVCENPLCWREDELYIE